MILLLWYGVSESSVLADYFYSCMSCGWMFEGIVTTSQFEDLKKKIGYIRYAIAFL